MARKDFVRTLLPAALVALVAGPATAQQMLGSNSPAYGTLSTSDQRDSDGSYYDEYIFEVRSGGTYSVEMNSDDFDTYLRLYSISGNRSLLESDDDGADLPLDSRITRYLSPGTYLAQATSLGSGRTGAYRLTLSGGGGGGGGNAGAGSIGINQQTSGYLGSGDNRSGGSWYDDYTIYLPSGTRVSIDMMASFDSYLNFGRGTGSGFSSIMTNDDGGDGLNARLVYTVPSSGTYTVRATSYREDQTGSYTLSVAGNAGRSVDWSESGYLGSGDRRASSGHYYDEWTFTASAGTTRTYELRSEDFDTYLEFGIGTGDSFHRLSSDDDGADTPLDSRLSITIPSDGTYTIRARALGSSGTGSYVIERY